MSDRWTLALGAWLLVGCGSAETESSPAKADSATGSDTNASSADTGSVAPATDSAPPSSDAAAEVAGDCATCAKLVGKVTRVAATKPQHGGKGTIYLAVFDHDPVGDRMNAKVVGQALLPSTDFNPDTASIAYEIGGLTPRSAAYYVIAFLDDDGNASSTGPSPSKGDLVSLDGISAPKVVLASPGTVTLDLPLTMAMPF